MTITLSPEDLADLHLLRVLGHRADRVDHGRKGAYGVAVGGSSDAAVSATFTIK